MPDSAPTFAQQCREASIVGQEEISLLTKSSIHPLTTPAFLFFFFYNFNSCVGHFSLTWKTTTQRCSFFSQKEKLKLKIFSSFFFAGGGILQHFITKSHLEWAEGNRLISKIVSIMRKGLMGESVRILNDSCSSTGTRAMRWHIIAAFLAQETWHAEAASRCLTITKWGYECRRFFF